LLVGGNNLPIELKKSEKENFVKVPPVKYTINHVDKLYEEENKQIVFYKNTYELARFNLIKTRNVLGFQIGKSYYIAKYQNRYYYLNEMQCNILSNYINDNN